MKTFAIVVIFILILACFFFTARFVYHAVSATLEGWEVDLLVACGSGLLAVILVALIGKQK